MRYDAALRHLMKRIMAAVLSKQLAKQLSVIALMVGVLSVSACSSWIYRIDVPQGNFLEQKDIDKLRIAMTKEQVLFVLGNPVAENSFDPNVWHYIYHLKNGRSDDHIEKKLILTFNKDQRLASMSGDFAVPANFNTPLDQS
jgi:outer membrane protein assembly factor BamE